MWCEQKNRPYQTLRWTLLKHVGLTSVSPQWKCLSPVSWEVRRGRCDGPGRGWAGSSKHSLEPVPKPRKTGQTETHEVRSRWELRFPYGALKMIQKANTIANLRTCVMHRPASLATIHPFPLYSSLLCILKMMMEFCVPFSL